ncbi:MAG: hypothetical protein ACMUJJ_11350 [Roseicyclus sp.]|uniref:hypothetical protein n=1 Tax=Roseicyclus sp. TaxID=1914329 RepID=UPI003A83DAE2
MPSRNWPRWRHGWASGRCAHRLQALAVARASAALSGEDCIESADLLLAVELVLAPRATQIPETEQSAPEDSPEDAPEPPPEAEDKPETEQDEDQDRPAPRRDAAGSSQGHAAPRSIGAAGCRARGTVQPIGERVGGCEKGQPSRAPPALARGASRWRCAGRPGGDLARRRPLATDAPQAGGSA